jgi:hypothetical protein
LPQELKNTILSYLDDKTRRMMRSTSTDWSEIINYDQFTIYFMRLSAIPALVKTFSRYNKPIGLTFAKTIGPIDKSYTMLGTLTNLTMLEVESRVEFSLSGKSNFAQEDLNHFTTLTNLQHLNFRNLQLTDKETQHLHNLTYLTVGSKAFENLKYLTKLQRLQYLPVVIKSPENIIAKLGNPSALKFLATNGGMVLDAQSVAKLSNLSKVSIDSHNELFPFNKLPNLESLWISSDRFADFSVNTKLTFLHIAAKPSRSRSLVMSAMNHDYQQLTALTNLRELSLHIQLQDDQYSFLNKLTNVEMLRVLQRGIPLHGKFMQFVNSSNLTSIVIPALEKMEFISHLTNLQCIQVGSGTRNPCNSFQLKNVTKLIGPYLESTTVFPNLKQLQVYNNLDVDSDLLSSLTQLESLQLETIMNPSLQLLAGLTNLTELIARVDNNTDHPYDFEVLTHLTNLKILRLWDNLEYKRLPSRVLWKAIRKLTNLESLSLFHINADSLKTITRLRKLKHLSIVGPEAENFDDAKFSRLTNLQTLTLSTGLMGHFTSNRECKLNLPYLYSASFM